MYALVDCNSFYASCERIFRPELRTKPCIILSNCDATIVTQTKEATALGIEKFKPYFQVKEICDRHNVYVASSNYELYGDISARVMDTLATEAPDISVYSCDESFTDFTNCPTIDLREKGRHIKDRLWREVRMPVCVGFGKTKTLAKLANHIAKKHEKANGVCCLDDPEQIARWLKKFPVKQVWGIGAKLAERLNILNIYTAYELANADKKYLRKQLSVNVERTARELCGEICLDFHETVADKKQIVVSRMFGVKITSKQVLQEAIANYACMAAVKLRKQKGKVRTLLVTAQSSYYSDNFRSSKKVIKLQLPTSSTDIILKAIAGAMDELYREGVVYARAMVALIELTDSRHEQFDLLEPTERPEKEALLRLMDHLNKDNKNQIQFGRQGIQKQWSMRRDFKSPSYTTKWTDIPKVT